FRLRTEVLTLEKAASRFLYYNVDFPFISVFTCLRIYIRIRIYTDRKGRIRECPKPKNNNNHGNPGGRNNAPARVYTVGRAGTDPDVNVVTELGSFDAIIDMDWLAKYQAVIACAEKIVRIP
nr:putative reverse transcriptase domain-containing protein [Tanacetum cinerariifolium]